MKNVLMGIDFSLNSTGICYEIDYKNYYINFFNECKFNYKKKNFNLHDELQNKGILFDLFYNIDNLNVVTRHAEPIEKPKDIGLNIWEHKHLYRTLQYIDLIIDSIKEIKDNYPNRNFIVGIENYSYNSFGDNTIQIIEMTMLLKTELIKHDICSIENIHIITSPVIKLKYAGNGNAIKYDMFKAYLNENLQSDNFQNFLRQYENSCFKEKYKTIKATKKKPERQISDHEMISPIDDIIDAYFVKEYCKKYI